MPVTSAQTGLGIKFAIGNGTGGSSTSYADVAVEVTNVVVPNLKRAANDATHLNSPEDYEEYIGGRKGMDPTTIEFNYTPDAADAIYTHWQIGSGDYQFTYRNGVRIQFSGVPTNWKPGDGSEETMKGSLTIQPSGPPTLLAPV